MDEQDRKARIATILELISYSGDTDAEKRTRYDRVQQHQRAVSDAYGDLRGWTRAGESFPIRALARVSTIGEEWNREFTDHRGFWKANGRPVAVSAHLYSCDEAQREAAHSWAYSRGLVATFPVDFPSWWYPGRTTLIEITRAS